jgi:hypothetical protein
MLTRLAVILVAVAGAAPAFAQKGEWITDAKSGCRVWTSVPQLDYWISWSGECRNGLATGRGQLQWFQAEKLLSRTDCEMAEGKITGRTIVYYTNGNRYEGEFQDNRYHGHGTVQYANGMRFEGEFRDGLPNGNGTFIGNGQTFTGNWTKGCFSQGDVHIWVVTTQAACGFK